MGLPKPKQTLFTVDDYLRIERAADDRHIYVDGEIFAMAGESLPHGYITLNLAGLFFNYLRGKPCAAFTKDMKIRSGPLATPMGGRSTKGMFSYPDLVIVCGEPEFHDEYEDVILNPTVIVEVLSPSTEVFDRGEKWARFQTWNPTLKDYLLVAQDQPKIEHYERQEVNWSYAVYQGLEAVVPLRSIDCALKLAEVYERVRWENPAS